MICSYDHVKELRCGAIGHQSYVVVALSRYFHSINLMCCTFRWFRWSITAFTLISFSLANECRRAYKEMWLLSPFTIFSLFLWARACVCSCVSMSLNEWDNVSVIFEFRILMWDLPFCWLFMLGFHRFMYRNCENKEINSNKKYKWRTTQ